LRTSLQISNLAERAAKKWKGEKRRSIVYVTKLAKIPIQTLSFSRNKTNEEGYGKKIKKRQTKGDERRSRGKGPCCYQGEQTHTLTGNESGERRE